MGIQILMYLQNFIIHLNHYQNQKHHPAKYVPQRYSNEKEMQQESEMPNKPNYRHPARYAPKRYPKYDSPKVKREFEDRIITLEEDVKQLQELLYELQHD